MKYEDEFKWMRSQAPRFAANVAKTYKLLEILWQREDGQMYSPTEADILGSVEKEIGDLEDRFRSGDTQIRGSGTGHFEIGIDDHTWGDPEHPAPYIRFTYEIIRLGRSDRTHG